MLWVLLWKLWMKKTLKEKQAFAERCFRGWEPVCEISGV